MKKLFGVVLLVLFTFISNSNAQDQTDVLFCLKDMGDTSALAPVLEKLESRKITYKILAFGVAKASFEGHPHMLDVSKQCGEDAPTLDVDSPRDQKLSQNQLECVKRSVTPKIVVAGMASSAQAQVLNLFKSTGSRVYAYYDNFDSVVGKDYVQPFFEAIKTVDAYLVPSRSSLPGFKELQKTKNSEHIVVGQPSLENWDQIFSEVNSFSLRTQLGLMAHDKVVVFAGGYDETYAESFKTFVSGMKKLAPLRAFVIAHPRVDGVFEKTLVDQEKASNISVVNVSNLPTSVMSTLASLVVCHKSSVGMQALYKGRPVIYVARKDDYTNFSIKKGVAVQVETPDEFYEEAKRLLAIRDRPKSPLKKLGIPNNASEKIATYFHRVLKNKKRST
ncbi:MAG: hypothetical protein HOI80_05545 [Alphaproteobacteria bacterium]|jgi:hypothetical protein|nr:hypothetical protein [Alphaproteobacteria bacterium]MBT5389322.1 hypothetical protein [Alphaproteobacteria bacterium]MBT5540816.1 hypothetical protein [Alphaproteobacteria bacterium]MBT5654940.1 hypothetical protein [Alphaproteobacteria bacterium]